MDVNLDNNTVTVSFLFATVTQYDPEIAITYNLGYALGCFKKYSTTSEHISVT
ncbi:hypothetical protein KKH23_04285 [Patescibacteria group bacterium]|nr:hypothetical protein [Patescibacteria group bacterium]